MLRFLSRGVVTSQVFWGVSWKSWRPVLGLPTDPYSVDYPTDYPKINVDQISFCEEIDSTILPALRCLRIHQQPPSCFSPTSSTQSFFQPRPIRFWPPASMPLEDGWSVSVSWWMLIVLICCKCLPSTIQLPLSSSFNPSFLTSELEIIETISEDDENDTQTGNLNYSFVNNNNDYGFLERFFPRIQKRCLQRLTNSNENKNK